MLQDYIQEEQTKLFEEMGVFFAFNDKQFKEGVDKNKHRLPEGGEWSHVFGGMIMPSANVEEFLKRHSEIVRKGQERDLKENGRSGVLQREIANYELGYSYDGINDPNFRDGIDGYGFTEEEIREEFEKHLKVHEY